MLYFEDSKHIHYIADKSDLFIETAQHKNKLGGVYEN